MSYHVRSCTFVTYLMVLFLWSCSYGPVLMVLSLAISRMDFVVSVIAYVPRL